MKVAELTNEEMFSVCGLDCSVCSAHLRTNKPCVGCLIEGENKPVHCLNCSKKKCAKEKGVTHCYECDEYPCKKIKVADRKYKEKYGVSLIKNNMLVKKTGADSFYEIQRKEYKCSECDGVFDVHNKCCSECGHINK